MRRGAILASAHPRLPPATSWSVVMTTPRILIVDDSAGDRELFTEAFHSEAPTLAVHSVPNVQQAVGELQVAHFAQRSFSVLLLDAMMDGEFPSELLRFIRANPTHQQLHVAVISTAISPQVTQEYRRFGVEHFVTKPSSWQEFLAFARVIQTTFLQTGQQSPWGVLAIGAPGDAHGRR
jgi:CheY-like chemotaxis protein